MKTFKLLKLDTPLKDENNLIYPRDVVEFDILDDPMIRVLVESKTFYISKLRKNKDINVLNINTKDVIGYVSKFFIDDDNYLCCDVESLFTNKEIVDVTFLPQIEIDFEMNKVTRIDFFKLFGKNKKLKS